MEDKIPLNNMIEDALRDTPETPGSMDINSVILMMMADSMKERNEALKMFLSDDKYKTVLTDQQRHLLPLMLNVAFTPFESTGRMLRKLGRSEEYIKQVEEEQKIHFLIEYIPEFLRAGIAVNRAGRGEDERVLTGALTSPMDIRTNQGGSNNGPQKL